MTDRIDLQHGQVSATISPLGAEVLSLRQAEIGEVIWQADSDAWRRRSPLLFPIIGRYPAGIVTVGGMPLNLPPHGFAPESAFAVIEASRTVCELELISSAATLDIYPFHFRLSARHQLHDAGLLSVFTVTNFSGTVAMPFMLGGHPGFCWPLPKAGDRASHMLRFDQREERSTSILTTTELVRSEHPFDGRRLRPSDMNFVGRTHALVGLNSRKIRFGTDKVFVNLAYEGLGNLALWTRDDAPFLCLEPWSNMPIFVEAPTEMAEVKDMTLLPPGQSMTFSMDITLGGTALHAAGQSSAR